jgi:hypothetical protein
VQDAVWLVLVGFNDLCESSKVIERVQGGWGVENGVWRWKRGFGGEVLGVSAVVSHLSRKTSEMWGTRRLFGGRRTDDTLIGLRPVVFGPRTLVRT